MKISRYVVFIPTVLCLWVLLEPIFGLNFLGEDLSILKLPLVFLGAILVAVWFKQLMRPAPDTNISSSDENKESELTKLAAVHWHDHMNHLHNSKHYTMSWRNSNGPFPPSHLLSISDQNPKAEVKVMSYNLFLRPPLVKTNADDFKNERTNEFLKVIGDYDVIALQEVFSFCNWRQRKIIQESKKLGFHYHAKSTGPEWFHWKIPFFDGGLVILSKFPIVETDRMIFKHGTQIDGRVAKQVLYAKIQLSPDHFFHLFTTHMQANYHENSEKINCKNSSMRMLQIEEMACFVKLKTQHCEHPVIIAGDLNVNARTAVDEGNHLALTCSNEYLHLMNQFDSDIYLDLVREQFGGHPITYGDFYHEEGRTIPKETVLTHQVDHCRPEYLDYILFKDGKQKQKMYVKKESTRIEPFFVPEHQKGKVPFTQLSDHYAVTTTLICHS